MKTPMNTYQRNMNRAAAMLLLPLGLGLAGCASLQENVAASRKEHIIPGKTTQIKDMHFYRFCEVALITGTSMGNAVANFYNTTGASDPTPEQFAKLDADKLAKQFHARKVHLNPVRWWTFNEIDINEMGDTQDFEGIKATWMAVVGVEAMEKAVVKIEWIPGSIYRNNAFKFSPGTEVYLLDAPNGEVFVMQSYTDYYDKSLTPATLKDIGSKLTFPAGWKFRTKVLDRELVVSTERANFYAHVLQDNLHNTYQGSDGGKAFNYIP